MGAAPILKYSMADYFEMELASLEKHEYYDGEIFAMAGASVAHNRIVRNTSTKIDGHLMKSSGCEIFPSDLRISVEASDFVSYPDLAIVCGPISTFKERTDTVTNPSVIIEVLSTSTLNYDRGQKFHFYRQIPSLTSYVLISSLGILVETYHKQTDGSWLLNSYGAGDSFTIEPIGLTVAVQELYRNVIFD